MRRGCWCSTRPPIRRSSSVVSPGWRRSDATKVPGESIALLTDRVRLAEHRKQLYGSQLEGDCSVGYKLRPVEDEANLDARRARLDLPPMADYLQFMSTAFCATKSP